ncbi:MAG: TrmH family RNA methyltransferase [Spirochaetes bacterium]|nr:TrmH family RNA methyltransferase [Spirochaetota bacterium]
MISIRKLISLPPKTRIRKLIQLIDQWEQSPETLLNQTSMIMQYCSSLPEADFSSLGRFILYTQTIQEFESILGRYEPSDQLLILHRRLLHRIRFFLQEEIGIEPAEWDFYQTQRDLTNREDFPPWNGICLYLDEIRSPYNVGSIFRTAACFGVERILLAPGTASPTHPRAKRSAMGTIEMVPWEITSPETLNEEPNLFALETGGTALEDFSFPPHGICIVGSEELGVDPRLLALAKKRRGIVSIPLYGLKTSLNVSVAVGILIQHWVRQLVPR